MNEDKQLLFYSANNLNTPKEIKELQELAKRIKPSIDPLEELEKIKKENEEKGIEEKSTTYYNCFISNKYIYIDFLQPPFSYSFIQNNEGAIAFINKDKVKFFKNKEEAAKDSDLKEALELSKDIENYFKHPSFKDFKIRKIRLGNNQFNYQYLNNKKTKIQEYEEEIESIKNDKEEWIEYTKEEAIEELLREKEYTGELEEKNFNSHLLNSLLACYTYFNNYSLESNNIIAPPIRLLPNTIYDKLLNINKYFKNKEIGVDWRLSQLNTADYKGFNYNALIKDFNKAIGEVFKTCYKIEIPAVTKKGKYEVKPIPNLYYSKAIKYSDKAFTLNDFEEYEADLPFTFNIEGENYKNTYNLSVAKEAVENYFNEKNIDSFKLTAFQKCLIEAIVGIELAYLHDIGIKPGDTIPENVRIRVSLKDINYLLGYIDKLTAKQAVRLNKELEFTGNIRGYTDMLEEYDKRGKSELRSKYGDYSIVRKPRLIYCDPIEIRNKNNREGLVNDGIEIYKLSPITIDAFNLNQILTYDTALLNPPGAPKFRGDLRMAPNFIMPKVTEIRNYNNRYKKKIARLEENIEQLEADLKDSNKSNDTLRKEVITLLEIIDSLTIEEDKEQLLKEATNILKTIEKKDKEKNKLSKKKKQKHKSRKENYNHLNIDKTLKRCGRDISNKDIKSRSRIQVEEYVRALKKAGELNDAPYLEEHGKKNSNVIILDVSMD